MQPSDEQRPTASPHGELTQRLLQRATQPAGMIDVRHGEEIYGRTAGWVAQRFSLLEHWRSRYAADQGPFPAAEMPLRKSPPAPWAEPHPVATSSQASSGPSVLMRSVEPGGASAISSASSPAEPPVLKLRVKRGGPAQGPSSPSITAAIPQAQGSSPEMVLRRKPSESSASVISGKTENIHAPESLPHVQEIPSINPALQMHLQRKAEITAHRAGDAPAGASPAALELSPSEAGPAHQQGKAVPAETSPAATVSSQPSPAVEVLPRAVELRAGSSHAPALHLQRKAIPSEISSAAAPVANGNGSGMAGGAGVPRIAVAREIPFTSAASAPAMVWRKAESNGAAAEAGTGRSAPAFLPTAFAPPQIMRQADPGSAPSVLSGAPQGAAAPAASGNNGFNMQRVAEHVGRILARQLAIERERRGKS